MSSAVGVGPVVGVEGGGGGMVGWGGGIVRLGGCVVALELCARCVDGMDCAGEGRHGFTCRLNRTCSSSAIVRGNIP